MCYHGRFCRRQVLLRSPSRRNSQRLLFYSSHSILFPKAFMGEKPSLVPGTLDMLILKALTRGPMHGYAIVEFIHKRSEDVLRVEEGALYPALHRLELRGLLKADWGLSDNNRRAKFYALTAAGRKCLAEEASGWRRLSAAISRVM